MTNKQYYRMQVLMLKDEVLKLSQAERDELFSLLELSEKEVSLNDQSKNVPNPSLYCNA